MENRKLIRWVLAFGILAVALGAFGAHALKPMMDESGINNFNTGNRYHFYHTLFALMILLLDNPTSKLSLLAFRLALIGVVLFSGSLYLMALRSTINLPTWLPILTPVGGLCFLSAWFIMFLKFFGAKGKN